MKKYILIIFILTSLFSCSLPEPKKMIAYEDCKEVIDKQTPIENDFSGVDFFLGNGSITKSQTNYYLVFEDWSDESVSRQKFNKHKVWDEYCITRYYYQ